MTPAPAIRPGALLPGLVTRVLADGLVHSACSLLLSPLSVLASRNSTRMSFEGSFDHRAPHSTPVIFVHGLFGHSSQFHFLHRFLGACGFQNFAAFSYAPRLDHEALARRLGWAIEAVCEASGASVVDVVGHSLGGLAARHLLETGNNNLVRRLVTIGSPYLTDALPEREFAIFGTADAIIPPPARAVRGRRAIVVGVGHLGLLYHPVALQLVAAALGERAEEQPEAARARAA
jgi:pimeloyl-ACP methyl ester carboxylesterase